MNPIQILVCLLICFSVVSTFKMSDLSAVKNPQTDCTNTTNFDFMSIEYMAKNTFMKDTLAYINEKYRIYLHGVSLKVNETDSYSIQSFQLNITYDDRNQTSSWGQNQAILIEGGKFQVSLMFDWYHLKNDRVSVSGKGTASAISKEVPFTINIHRESALASISWTGFELGQLMNITFPEIPLTSSSCDNDYDNLNSGSDCVVSDEDKFLLTYLLYKAPADIESIKNQLYSKLNPLIKQYLQFFICCGNSPTCTDFTYDIKDPEERHTFRVNVGKRNVSIILDKTGSKPGIYSRYMAQMNSTTDTCGPVPANSTLDIKTFGGGQEFISFTVFENLLRIGIQEGQLDTYAMKSNWATKNFKFSVGQLSNFLSNINSTFSPSTLIYGVCKADRSNFKISKGSSNSTVKVFTSSKCYLESESEKTIIYFTLNLTSSVYPNFWGDKFDVWLKSFTVDVSYDDNYGFKLTNKTLADQIVKDSLEKLYEIPLFGSGWPYFLFQKNPTLYVTENAVLIYDKPQ